MKKAFIKILDVSFLYDDKEFNKYYEKMPEYRRKKIDFFKFKKDKCLSLGAGILMNDLIQHAKEKLFTEDGQKSFEVDFSEQGKPFFKYQPDLYFSLAHSEKKVIAAISQKRIGVDIEKIDEKNKINLSEWTKAESYVKALGLSLSDFIEGRILLPPETSFTQWSADGYIFCIYEERL
ncbi:MAG: hypothetical protein K6F15_02605 [Treponema sp.]|nr:hypothetical protein [Treponema sp.]